MQSLCHRTIPCRSKAGGDQYGQNLRSASYTPNSLNQYTSRTVPGGFDMVGVANKDAANGTHFAAYDLNGNVMGLVNAANGTISAQYEYGPFGEVIRMTGPMARLNPFRFSTKYQDDETDLLYYGYRYYSASTGRWLSRDPIVERGGINLYAFCGNDSVNKFDAVGLSVWICTCNWGNAKEALSRHAYLWDDIRNMSCGRNAKCSSGNANGSNDDLGPGKPGQTCSKVPGSEGKEQQIMSECQKSGNVGPWIPFLNDCHTAVDRACKKSGVTPPPHPRLNDNPHILPKFINTDWGNTDPITGMAYPL